MPKSEYTVAEAAEELGINARTLRRLIKEGKIPAYKPNPLSKTSGYRITQETIDWFKDLQNRPSSG